MSSPFPSANTTHLGDTPNTTPPAPIESHDIPMDSELVEEVEGHDEELEQLLTLPLSKIKRIFKMDPEYTAASQSAVYATGLATELFVQYFVEQASLIAKMEKRKKIQYKDFSEAVSSHDALSFLSDTVPKTQAIGALIQQNKVNLISNNDIPVENEQDDDEDDVEEVQIIDDVPKRAKLLPKGQQTLQFSALKPETQVRKAVIHDLVSSNTNTPPPPESSDILMNE